MEETMMGVQVQQMDSGIGIGMILFYLVIYVFFAYCLARLGKKLGMPMGTAFIWAVIPIANMFYLLKLAVKPMWWFILMLIPIVNIVISILIWIAISERLGKPGWWGIMIGIVPIANIIFFFMLVFGKTDEISASAAPAA